MKTIETLDPKPFRRLCMTIGELPTSYLDSMTYYEMVAWLCEYIKKNVVTAINDHALAIKEIQDWIETLDLQDEVDDKIDRMKESGELAEIITQYLEVHGILAFDSVADMKSAENLVDGSFVETYGFYNKNDGGGAKYKIREVTNQDNVDEMFLIAIGDDNLVAEIIIEKSLSARQIGAKGDGETDDAAVLNAFFDAEIGCKKIVPKGTYVINSTVFIKGKWTNSHTGNLSDVYFDEASIKYMGAADGYSVVIYNTKNQVLSGLNIDINSNSNHVGIVGCWEAKFKNFVVKDLMLCNDSTILSGKTYATLAIQHITFDGCVIKGKTTIDSDDNSYINGVYFNECIFSGKVTNSPDPATWEPYLIVLGGTKNKEEINFTNCDLSYASTAIFNIEQNQVGTYANSLGRASVKCESCYFDTTVNMVKDFDNKNMTFRMMNCNFAGNNIVMTPSLLYSDQLKNTQLNSANVFPDYLPTGNINLAYNGDFSTTGTYGSGQYITGSDTATVTKSYVSSTRNAHGRARQVVLTANSTLRSAMVSTPTEGIYTFYVRLMLKSGSNVTARLIFGENGEATSYVDLPLGKEIVLSTNKSMQTFNANVDLQPKLTINGATEENPVTIELYEVIVSPGRMILPNTPLHIGAVVS